MILEGAGVCPLVKIGDVVKGRTVVDLVCDINAMAACKAFRAMAIITFGKGLEIDDYMNPANASSVNCDACPILAADPNHRRKTKHPSELLGEPFVGERRGKLLVQEPKDIEPEHQSNRFELIDLSEEED